MGKIVLTTSYDILIYKSAKKWEVDGNLVKAIIKVESGFKADAERHTEKEHSRGLMQINAPTGIALGIKQTELDSLYDPYINVETGCKLLQMLKRCYPNILDQIASYNAGRVILKKDGSYVNAKYVSNVYRDWLLYTFTNPLNLAI